MIDASRTVRWSVDRVSDQTYDTTKPVRVVAGRPRLRRPSVGALRNLAAFLFILSIPIALITTTVRFVANEPRVYRYAIDDFGGAQTTGISREELIRAGGELRRYFNNGQETVAIRVRDDGSEVPLFNPQEASHLRDVKARFQWLNRAQELSVLYALAYIAAVVLWS